MNIEQQEDKASEYKEEKSGVVEPDVYVDGGESKAIQTKCKNKIKLKIDKFFKITERGSSIKQEFIGGLVNFLVLSYILVVIPGIFGGVGGAGLWKALFVATILTTIISTIAMALSANLPIVMAPGIGLASYAVQLIETAQYTYAQAMALCFMAGVAFVIITVTGLRKKIVNAIPQSIKLAIPAGVGLFVLGIGMNSSNSGILDLLNGTATSYAPVVAIITLIIMIVLYIKNVKGGIFIGIVSGTILDIIIKSCMGQNPFAVLADGSWLPPFSEMIDNSLFQFDFAGLFDGNLLSAILSVVLVVFAILLIDLFDTVGTLFATAQKGGLLDKDGQVINMNRAMMIDGSAAIVSTCFGLPNATSYVESTAGIASGARTGLSGIFTSLFFILTLFLSPIVMLIPIYATAPALILVGLLMFDSVVKIDFKDYSAFIPAILTIIIMPLTSNITYGIAGGLIVYTLIMIFTGKAKKVNIFTYIISLLFILYFLMQYIS